MRRCPTKLCDGAQMVIFASFLRPVFSASRVQQVSDLHFKFALRPHQCVEVWQTSNLRRLRLGEKKKKKKKEEETTSNAWFPGPTPVLPNGISIGSTIFAGLTSVTDRPTDHATRSVTIGSICVCRTAMWPKRGEGVKHTSCYGLQPGSDVKHN